MRWLGGISVAIAKPDRVAGAEHYVVGAGSAHHRLVEVVAHRIVVGKIFEISRVALLYVVEGHGGRAFFGAHAVEAGGLGESVGAGADRDFEPGEQVAQASAGVLACSIRRAAIKLLPHLVEAVDRAIVVRIVRVCLGGELERARGQGGGVRNASVDISMVQSGAAGGQVDVIVVRQTILIKLGSRHIREGWCGISTGKDRRQY